MGLLRLGEGAHGWCPHEWRVYEVSSPVKDLTGLAALVLDIPDLTPRLQAEVAPLLELHPLPPVVLRTGAGLSNRISVSTLPVPHIIWADFTPTMQLDVLRRAVAESLFNTFWSSIRQHHKGPLPWVLERAMKRILGQDPLDEIPFVRTVDAVAAGLGCTVAHLSRVSSKAGIRLGSYVRWVTFLKAMAIRRQTGESWAAVGARLGFPSPSAWSTFARHLTGRSPTAASKIPLRVWIRLAARGSVVADQES